MKHLLVVTRSTPLHGLGGMEAVSWDLASAIAAKGIRVTILTTKLPGRPGLFAHDGMMIHALEAPSGRYSRSWWKISSATYKSVYASDVDSILSISSGAAAIAKAARLLGVPVFFQAHGTSWLEFQSHVKGGDIKSIVKAAKSLVAMVGDYRYGRYSGVIAISDSVYSDLMRYPTKAIISAVPVYRIYNGVNLDQFAFDPEERSRVRAGLRVQAKKVIISVSRLHRQKGIRESLAGFAEALKTSKELFFIILGTGPELEPLRKHAQRLGIAEHVHFGGNVSRYDLRRWLSAADLFLFTSRRMEGLPTNMLEASASGLPIVVSSHLADKRLCNASVDCDDPASISRAIVGVTVNRDRSSRLPREFNLSYCRDMYIELLRRHIDPG